MRHATRHGSKRSCGARSTGRCATPSNTCAVLRSSADELVPVVLRGLEAAASARGTAPKVHVTPDARTFVPPEWLDRTGAVIRADGPATEQLVEEIGPDRLGHEWEWEESPEITIARVRHRRRRCHRVQ